MVIAASVSAVSPEAGVVSICFDSDPAASSNCISNFDAAAMAALLEAFKLPLDPVAETRRLLFWVDGACFPEEATDVWLSCLTITADDSLAVDREEHESDFEGIILDENRG